MICIRSNNMKLILHAKKLGNGFNSASESRKFYILLMNPRELAEIRTFQDVLLHVCIFPNILPVRIAQYRAT